MKFKIKTFPRFYPQLSAFTLAETLITLLIIAIITVILIGVIKNNGIKQKVILSQYDVVYTQLADIVSMTAQNSEKYSDTYTTEPLTMKNLSCKNEDNLSECLKKALLKNSSVSQTALNSDKSFKNYTETNDALAFMFNGKTNTSSLPVFTLPSSAQVAVSYFDKTCSTEIPVYKKGNTIETVKACGFLLADVNNIKKPNNYAGNNTIKDTFLMPITKNGLERSQYVLNEIAGCSEGNAYNPATHSCVNGNNLCPNDYFFNQIIFNPDKMVKQTVSYNGTECQEYACKDGTALTIKEQCLGHELCRFGNEWDDAAKACICRAPNVSSQTFINGETVNYCHPPCQNGQDWDGNTAQCTCQKGAEDSGYCHTPCTGGQSWNGSSKTCECPSGQNWSGSQCIACGENQNWNGTSCQCNTGYTWDGSTCKIAKECRRDGNNRGFMVAGIWEDSGAEVLVDMTWDSVTVYSNNVGNVRGDAFWLSNAINTYENQMVNGSAYNGYKYTVDKGSKNTVAGTGFNRGGTETTYTVCREKT